MDDHGREHITCTTQDHGTIDYIIYDGTSPKDSAPSVRSPTKTKATQLLKKLSLFSLAESMDPGPATLTVPLTIQQVVILITLILLVMVVLQIPTILFYVNSPSSSPMTSTSFINEIDFSTCSANRPAVSNGTLSDFCPEIPPLGNQDESTYNLCLNSALSLVQAIHTVTLVSNNEQCNNAAIPFFCNAVFSLCSDDSIAEDLEEECVHVRDDNCTIEWRVLENIFSVPIPSCESFVANGTLTVTKAPPLTCPDQFNIFCDSVCLPSCSDFSQFPEVAAIANYAIMLIFELIGLISGVITLIACLFNRKKMFKFPQIYIVYNTILFIIIMIVLVIPLIFGREGLMCSDSNAIEALQNPTGYCQAQGFVLHSGILCFCGFWLLHLAHLFFALAFPFKAKKFMGNYGRIVHIVEVIVVIVLGSVPGAIVLGTSHYGFDRFPPDLCVPSDPTVFFYSFSLTVSIGSTIGLAMLFSTFIILRRNHQLKKARIEGESSNNSHVLLKVIKILCVGFSTPEAKLFILFWYYVFIVVILLANFTVFLYNRESLAANLENFFICSADGSTDCEVHRDRANDISTPTYYLDLVSTIVLCLINLSNLMYVLQFYDIKKFILRLYHKSQNNNSNA